MGYNSIEERLRRMSDTEIHSLKQRLEQANFPIRFTNPRFLNTADRFNLSLEQKVDRELKRRQRVLVR